MNILTLTASRIDRAQVTGEMKVKDTWEILDVKAFIISISYILFIHKNSNFFYSFL